MRIVNVFTVGLFFLALCCCNSKEKKEIKPNIIYILADDLGYAELGVYGQKKIETPNIDALANSGMLFSQHYAGAPVCAPSRAVLLTGKHLGHVPIRGNDAWKSRGAVLDYKAVIKDSTLEGQRPLPKQTKTIANLLKDSGYKTAIVGKWGLGAPNTDAIPTKMGFDYFFGYNCQRQAHTYTPVHLYENEVRYHLTKNDTIAPRTGISLNADPLNLESYNKYSQPIYSPTIIFEKMMGFVEVNKEHPFFLYWATPLPHLPLQAPKKWVNYYVDKFGDEKPYFFKEGERKGYFPTRYPRATYAAMVSYLDENIGKLVNYLKAEGLYDNTLIIFTSDNGPSYTGGTDSPWFDSAAPFSSKFGRGKGFLYEGGIRVPMIATWPNRIKAGSKTDHVSAFWDVMPTFCDIVSIDAPKDTDGISFMNTLIQKGNQDSHEYLYWEFPEYKGQVAIRLGKWKLIWKNIRKGNKAIELYNLETDISETNNISSDYPEIVERLYEIIKKEHSRPQIESFIIKELELINKSIK